MFVAFVAFIAGFLGIVTAIYVVPLAGIALRLSPEIIFALIVPTGVGFAVFGLSVARARPVIADLWRRSSGWLRIGAGWRVNGRQRRGAT